MVATSVLLPPRLLLLQLLTMQGGNGSDRAQPRSHTLPTWWQHTAPGGTDQQHLQLPLSAAADAAMI